MRLRRCLSSAPSWRHHAAARVHPETAPQNQPPHGGHRALRRDSPVLGGRHSSGQGNRSHPNSSCLQIPPLTLPRPPARIAWQPVTTVLGLSLINIGFQRNSFVGGTVTFLFVARFSVLDSIEDRQIRSLEKSLKKKESLSRILVAIADSRFTPRVSAHLLECLPHLPLYSGGRGCGRTTTPMLNSDCSFGSSSRTFRSLPYKLSIH